MIANSTIIRKKNFKCKIVHTIERENGKFVKETIILPKSIHT